jgi:2-polyprenyl-6-methoxyphenol hydroxylase-like FAD-dependent oxidoreductase
MVSKVIKKVSIVGGGLGGLALGQFLKSVPGYQVTIFERDASAEHRSQGYQIGIHGYGLESLKTLKLSGLDDLLAENPMKGVLILDGQSLKPFVRFPTPGASLVNRWKLRDLLLQDLENGENSHIEWNKRFTSYQTSEEDVKVTFEDGSIVSSDYLIGCDGVHSKVRGLYRPDLKFQNVGVAAIAGFLPDDGASKNFEFFSKMVTENLVRTQLPLRHSLLSMKFFDKHDKKQQLLWALSYDKEFYQHKATAFGQTVYPITPEMTSHEIKQAILNRIKGINCSPEIMNMIENTPDENIMLQKDYTSMVPTKNAVINQNPSTMNDIKRVTLLGDAAHAMTSHGGLGANTAFKDAYELSQFFMKNSEILEKEGFLNYEKDLYKRGYKAVNFSLGNTKQIHSDPSFIGDIILSSMGIIVRGYNFLTTGKFRL